jgi:hypothetical protein
MGFEEKTKHLDSTMVEVPDVYAGHNDCIFVK